MDSPWKTSTARARHALPGSELVIIPLASHLSNLEQPAAFTRALALFLNKHR